eukprot:Rhum_TRINITY_DN15902_c0_g1::Rhum_TRINITY_DN15902_c0_g1_i1::g.162408::m.162408
MLCRTQCLREVKRKVILGRGVPEVLNQYNPGAAVIGTKPFGTHTPETYEYFRLRLRQKLGNDELNPASVMNWRKYELAPKENRANPDSFHYEQYKHGGAAYQQVFHEDLLRLSEYPEKGVVVVDVRSDFSKVKKYIPFSVRIPMEELTYALQLEPKQFEQMYGFAPIEHGAEIICVSHDGVASEKALKTFARWGHSADNLYNFRGGTNVLFDEQHSDFTKAVEDVDSDDHKSGHYPVTRPDWLTQVGPFNPKYHPYPSSNLEEQLRRDDEGTWTSPTVPDTTSPTAKYTKRRNEYQQTVDSHWLRTRLVADVKWYDHTHREPFFRWKEPDLSHDRAFRPMAFRYNQFWKQGPQ